MQSKGFSNLTLDAITRYRFYRDAARHDCTETSRSIVSRSVDGKELIPRLKATTTDRAKIRWPAKALRARQPKGRSRQRLYAQACAAFCATGFYNGATTDGTHTSQESMSAFSLEHARLISTLHIIFSLLDFRGSRRSRARNVTFLRLLLSIAAVGATCTNGLERHELNG